MASTITTKDSPDQNFSKSFMYSIHQMYFLVQKRLEHVLLKHKGLTFSQFMILVGCNCSLTSTSHNHVSQLAIAEHLHLTEATVSRHISTLTRLNYVSRKQDTINKRQHSISITKKGLQEFKKAEAIITKELEVIFSVITTRDRSLIIKNFEKVLLQLLTKK